MATHPHLTLRLKKEYRYSSTALWAFMSSSRTKFALPLQIAKPLVCNLLHPSATACLSVSKNYLVSSAPYFQVPSVDGSCRRGEEIFHARIFTSKLCFCIIERLFYCDLSECNSDIHGQMRVQQRKTAPRLVTVAASSLLSYLMPIDMLASYKHWVFCTRPARHILTFSLDACGK